MLIIAHRGANNIAPENTKKAFLKAIDLGADYIEFDVRKTKDDELVIIHDSNTFLKYGTYFSVKKATLSQLKDLDMGEGERILTLQELVEISKNKIKLQCEIKVRGIVDKVLQILRDYDVVHDTLLSSFKHSELVKAKEIDSEIKIGLLSANPAGLFDRFKTNIIEQTRKRGFGAIHPYYPMVTQEFINIAHKHNLMVNPWTVDSPNDIEKMMRFGADGIITNDISQVKNILGV